jgi:hypothetical protein
MSEFEGNLIVVIRLDDGTMRFEPRRGFAILPGPGKPLPATQIERAAFFHLLRLHKGGRYRPKRTSPIGYE